MRKQYLKRFKMNIKEFEIPVPWGYIAVKAWGNEENTPVLTLHGVGENAGSFDRLLPYLPTSFYYICIDLPSHGKSSPYPAHLITIFDHIYTLKLLVEYLDRKRYIFMGHSWGGQTVLLFTQLYPEYSLKLIILEAFYVYPISADDLKSYLVKRFSSWIKINVTTAQNKPLYTYEEAVSKICNKRLFGKLNRESAEALLKRLLIPVEGEKFLFSNDNQLKSSVNPLFDIEFIEGLIKKYPITCPALFVYVSDSEWMRLYNFKRVEEELRKNKNCVIKKLISDDHEVHTNNPEIVAPIVAEFLNDIKSKL